jgi:hypothetical protein
MEGFEHERRGLFDGLQVPHSLNAIVIAAIGLIIYWLGIVGIESAHTGIPGDPTRHCRLIAGMLGNVTSRMGTLGWYLSHWGGWENAQTHYDMLAWVLFGGWTSAVWAFFSGAINRIAAMKLAREESLEIKEAFKFGARKFLPNLFSIGFVLAIIGFFYLVCNATIAGWIGRIPYVGDILLGIFFFLVLLSSFLVVFASALGALGFNLASSAIATESSDTFDGVSRAWNYVLARPWTVLLSYLATFLYVALFLFFGQWFLKVSVKSLSVGGWGLGSSEQVVEVDKDVREKLGLSSTMRLHSVAIPGKGDYFYRNLIGGDFQADDKGRIYYRQGLEYALEKHKGHTKRYPETLDGLIHPPLEGAETWLGPYLDTKGQVPNDPWGRPLVYEVDAKKFNDGYRVSSMGKDGTPNTPDDLTLAQLELETGRHGPLLNVAALLEGSTSFARYALFFWVKLVANLLIYGYVIAYFFSAQTMLYFLLRRDVEGDDYTEIVLDENADEALQYQVAAANGERKTLPAAGDDAPSGK